jgi:hypothetical protein
MGNRIGQAAAIFILIGILFSQFLISRELTPASMAAVQQPQAVCADGFALWADSQNDSEALAWSSDSNQVQGNVHSNNDINISGSSNVIAGTIEYVTTFSDGGDGNNYTQPMQVSPAAIPAVYNITAYQPGGAAAAAAEAEGRYHYIDGDFVVSDGDVQLDGLYFVTGKVVLGGSGIHGTATIVAQKEIGISGSEQNLTAYSDGLLLLSERSGNGQAAIEISGSTSTFRGIVDAPSGEVVLSGSTNAFYGGLFGRMLDLGGSSLTIVFDTSYCPEDNPPTPTPPPSPTVGPTPTATSTRPPTPLSGLTFLPLAHFSLANTTGEPNDVCTQAYGLTPNVTHSFLAEDRDDWYHFILPEPGIVTIRLGNFVPVAGQIAAYQGASCDTALFLQNNGASALEKTLSLGLQPAGRYFLYVSNDGALNNADPYTLLVEAP